MNSVDLEAKKYKEQILKLKKYSKNMSVLMAEDYVPLHENLKRTLGLLFKRVDAVHNGKEAFSLYSKSTKQNTPYDIVLSDIVMPDINGVELTKSIKKINPLQSIVILSAYKEVDYLLDFINLGVRRFISKPVSLELFLDELHLVCLEIHNLDELSNNIAFSNELCYNKIEQVLYFKDRPVVLSKHESLIVEKLVSKLNLIVSNDEIVDYLYECGKEASYENIRKMMYRLRKKLPDEIIQNIHGLGYKIVQKIDN